MVECIMFLPMTLNSFTLLLNVPGATSFVDLKPFEGRQYDTFVEVCKARHLKENEQQWEDILREAALTHMPNAT